MGDIPGALAFASPMNRSSGANFSRLLDSPQYKPLLSHSKAESLRRIQLTAETYAEVGDRVIGSACSMGLSCCWLMCSGLCSIYYPLSAGCGNH